MAYNKEFVRKQMAETGSYKCAVCPYCNGTRDATIKYPERKPDPWTFWKKIGEPKYTVAPMVDQSELPFRMLCRRYGATLAYTPMFHSRSFAESAEYRRLQFSTCAADRPLFVQFCGHDADTVLGAARHVENDCDAVDLNLGCPQGIARRGHYGSFLMEHWDTIHCIVHTLRVELACPVTVKMRRFDDMSLTLRYARMLRDAGAHLIAVHGRTRLQKGADTGLADLRFIKAVKEHITDVPVLENGNIVTFADIAPNLAETKCDSAMSAEALLWDPRLFSNPARPVLTGRDYHCDKATRLDALNTTMEYLDFVEQYPVDLGMVKAHMFKMMYHSFEVHVEFRNELGAFNCGSQLDAANEDAERLTRGDVAANDDGCGDGCKPEKAPGAAAGEPSSPTSAATDGSLKTTTSSKREEEMEVFRHKLAMLRSLVSRTIAAEQECTLEGSLPKQSAASKKAEKAAQPDVFDEVDTFDLGCLTAGTS